MNYYFWNEVVLVSFEEINEGEINNYKITEEKAMEFSKDKKVAVLKSKNIDDKDIEKLIDVNLIINTETIKYMNRKMDCGLNIELPKWLEEKISIGEVALINLDTACLSEVINEFNKSKKKEDFTVNILGLGDVGSNMAIGLMLLGKGTIKKIGLYDLDEKRVKRWVIELGQIAQPMGRDFPEVVALKDEDLFECDLFAFTASKAVPAVGSDVKDVRIVQFKGNRQILSIFAKRARKEKYKGIFAVVSDPVDLLCKGAYVDSNTGEDGSLDYLGLKASQIKGYGLGVMYGRANYFAKNNDYNFENGRVYGPHGKGLIAANDVFNYNDEISKELTHLTETANLEVRELGYKPFIAPAFGSGALGILNTLQGNWHYSCVYLDGVFYGCLNRLTDYGVEIERLSYDEKLYSRLCQTHQELINKWEELK